MTSLDGSQAGARVEPPLALYVHIPWCVRKCPYCDFNSHQRPEALPERRYVARLLEDFTLQRGRVGQRAIASVFIGGGTPSLFSAHAVGALLDGLRGVDSDAEITLEANPGASDAERFSGYRAAGVNRLSIGVQSFDDAMLRRIGRIHDATQAIDAFRAARAAGFDNINLDLMHGLPEQSGDEAMLDLRTAIDLAPEHLSWYELTLEPNTPFHHRPPSLPDGDSVADIQEAGGGRLEQAGYRRYEISAHAAGAGNRCRHNLNYWRFGDYLAIGAGAHGKLSEADGRIWRHAMRRGPRDYLAATGEEAVSSRRELRRHDLIVEFMLNALRLVDGVPATLFTETTGLAFDLLARPLAEARALGLLSPVADRLQATPLGLSFLNDLLSLFDGNYSAHH